MMWSLLQLCFSCNIISTILYWDLVFTEQASVKSEVILFNISNDACIGLDQLVHSIFVIKIWTVALKIREIQSGETDKWLGYKVWSVAIFQFSLIISIQIAAWLVSGDK